MSKINRERNVAYVFLIIFSISDRVLNNWCSNGKNKFKSLLMNFWKAINYVVNISCMVSQHGKLILFLMKVLTFWK